MEPHNIWIARNICLDYNNWVISEKSLKSFKNEYWPSFIMLYSNWIPQNFKVSHMFIELQHFIKRKENDCFPSAISLIWLPLSYFCLQDDMVWIFWSTPRLKFQILEIEEDVNFYKNFSKPYTRFCKNNEKERSILTLEME